jgi:NAD(P)-dependent dehydrogenase (short-subunit alcohol dehydrogenase family)
MTPPTFDLSGKIALITGASRGIGQAIAAAYAGAGAAVVLASRKQEGVDAVAENIRNTGGEALALAAHTGDQAAVDGLIDQAVAAWGGVDILVNNAATNPQYGPMLSADEGHWDKILDVNVKGYFRLIQGCAPHMQARGGGKIINVASVAGIEPVAGMGIYSVSKAAVIMLTRALAVEMAAANIQVNALAPGFIRTQFSQAIWGNEMLNQRVLAMTPQQRMASPDELAGIALYLAAPASDFTTGAVFTVDGGLTAGRSIF